ADAIRPRRGQSETTAEVEYHPAVLAPPHPAAVFVSRGCPGLVSSLSALGGGHAWSGLSTFYCANVSRSTVDGNLKILDFVVRLNGGGPAPQETRGHEFFSFPPGPQLLAIYCKLRELARIFWPLPHDPLSPQTETKLDDWNVARSLSGPGQS